MDNNPIKYSEFIQPDQSVSNLITQLEQLQSKYSELQAKIKADAKAVENALKGVNSATEEGRETTRKAATDAEKLAKANDNLKQSQTDVAKELAVLKAKQQQQNNVNKLTAKLNASAEGSYNRLSAQYSLNKIKLNAMSKAQRETSKSGKKLEKDTKAIYEEMKRLQENTGKTSLNVGNYKDALGALPGPMGGVVQGAKAINKQFLTLLANPFIAIIALVAGIFIAITKSMKRSEEGQDKLNKVMIVASSIFDNFMDVLTLIGVALFEALPNAFKLFSNGFKSFVNNFKSGILKVRIAWNEFTGDAEEADKFKTELKDLVKETENLAAEQKKLKKEIGQTFETATAKAKDLGDEIQRDIKAASKLADAQAKYNRDERKFIVENAKLNKAASKAREESERIKFLNAEQSIKILEESFDMDEKALKNDLTLAKERASILQQASNLAVDDIAAKKEIAEADAKVFDLETRFNELRRQRIRRLNILRKEAFKQEKERMKAYADLNKFEQTAVISKNDAILDSETATFDAKNKALKENALLASQVLRENSAIDLAELDKRKELQLISENDYALQKRVLEAKLADDILKISNKLAKDQAKLSSDKKKREEKTKQDTIANGKEIIDQEYDLELSRIDLLKATEAEKTDLRLKAEKDRIQKILDLNKKAGGDLSALQISAMKNTIAKIDQEIAKNAKQSGGDLYSKLGINLDDEQKQAMADASAFTIENIRSIVAARIEAADMALQKSREESEEANSRLQQEIENRNAGYASNVEQAQKELQLKKKQEADALKEKKKAQKAQMAIDTITQTTGLLTASVNIWKSLSGIPFIGPALAVAAVGTMWASFAANKIKAKQATKQEFSEGGLEFLNGGTHASGNDTHIGFNSRGQDMRAERGEAVAVINPKNTRKYRSELPKIIKSLNSGTFEKAYSKSFIDENNNIIFAKDTSDFSKMENSLEAIRENGERQTYIDGKGRLVEVYKNIKRIYV